MEENTQWGRGGIILWLAGVTKTKFRVFRNEPQKYERQWTLLQDRLQIQNSKLKICSMNWKFQTWTLDISSSKLELLLRVWKPETNITGLIGLQFKWNNNELFKIVVHYGVLKRLSKIHYFDLPTHLATSKNVPLLSKGEYDELNRNQLLQ
jgi:hypothetical protein